MKISDLNSGIRYDKTWAVYAETPVTLNSTARFGRTHFENGGVDDGFVMIGWNSNIVDFILNYSEGDEDWLSEKDNTEEAIQAYLDQWNASRVATLEKEVKALKKELTRVKHQKRKLTEAK